MGSVLSSDARNLARVIRKLKCVAGLSDAAVQVICDVSIKRKISYSKNLWSMGDPAEFVGLILSGALEINKLNQRGNETCLGIFGPENAIGISALVKKGQYPGTARSVARDTEVLKMYLRPLLQNKKHPAFEEISTWLRELLLSHESVLRSKIDILSAGKVEQRVIELLGHLSSRFGIKIGRATYFIPFVITKTQISRLVEVRVETIIRLLSSWSKRGLLTFDKSGIQIMDLERLERMSEIDP